MVGRMRDLNESLFKDEQGIPAAAPIGPQLTGDTVINHPDEDTLDELYLPQLNEAVLKQSLIVKHQDLLQKIEQLNDLALIVLLAKRIRNTFAFLKNKLLVVSSEEVIGQPDANTDKIKASWDDFLSNYQDQITSDKTEAVIVLNGLRKLNKISKIEMIIIDGTKIARLVFTAEESEP